MPEPTRRPVLVGFDGSAPARRAAYWAAALAARSGHPLRLAHTLRWPLPELDGLDLPPGVLDVTRARASAAALVDNAARRCAEQEPGLDVRGELLTGGTVELLGRLATGAELLVLGASGQSAVGRVLLGSSAAELVRRVGSTVVVVRDQPQRPDAGARGHVVVGLDASAASAKVARFAFDVAAWRGWELTAVHAWSDLPLDALVPPDHAGIDEERAEEQARRRLGGLLTEPRAARPGVPVREVVAVDRPAQALLAAAAGAELLVVGRRGRAHSPEAPLGSVCHAVLHYAHCPVAVVG